MNPKLNHTENLTIPNVEKQPEAFRVVSPEEKLNLISSSILGGNQKVEILTKSIDTTKTQLVDVRNSLDLPQSEQDPPSIVHAKETIGKTKQELDTLSAEKSVIEATLPGHDGKNETPKLAEGFDKDPRLLGIEDELRKKWIEANGDPFSNPQKMADYGYYLHGSPLAPSSTAEAVFATRYPEDAKQYVEMEKTRIYQSVHEDPAIEAVGKDIQEMVRVRIDGNQDRNQEVWQIRAPIESRAWSQFVDDYPEKAEAYKTFGPIKHEFEGRERMRELEAHREQVRLDREAKEKESAEIKKGWDQLHESLMKDRLDSENSTKERADMTKGWNLPDESFVKDPLNHEKFVKGVNEQMSAPQTLNEIGSGTENNNEIGEKQKPLEITTARGSVYRYMPDGRTQRLKVATGELLEPQDVLAFVPPWDSFKDGGNKLYPEIFKGIDNEVQFEQVMLNYIKHHKVYVIDEKGNKLESNADIQKTPKVYLAFVDEENPKNNFSIPAAKDPELGYGTFDSRRFDDKDGNHMREQHLGNKIVDIKFEQKTMSEGKKESTLARLLREIKEKERAKNLPRFVGGGKGNLHDRGNQGGVRTTPATSHRKTRFVGDGKGNLSDLK